MSERYAVNMTHPTHFEQLNQDDIRYQSKFLIKSLVENFSSTEIDLILRGQLLTRQGLGELSDKFRRKIQNSRRDSISFQIRPEQFLIMLTLSSSIWPNLHYGQSGLCFSRMKDGGVYSFNNTILLPHGLNSQYARSRESYCQHEKHMLFVSAITHIHEIILWHQQTVYCDNGSLTMSAPLINDIISLLKSCAINY